MLVNVLWVLLPLVQAVSVSEYFQLFNVNDINNDNYHLTSMPLGTNGNGDVVVSGDDNVLTLQIDYNGFLKIQNSDNYLTVDSLDNYKLKVAGSSDKSHIFYITSNHLHFNQYFTYIACPNSDSSEYQLYVGNDKSVCNNGVVANLRPISTSSSTAINHYIPDILNTQQGVQIAEGSSILFELTETDTGTDTGTDSQQTVTEIISTVGSVATTGDQTTTVYQTVGAAGQTAGIESGGDLYISLSVGYLLSTFLSTSLIPTTSTITTRGKETVIVITTTTVTPCATTVTTSYVMATSSASASHCSKSCNTVTITLIATGAFDFNYSSLSLLTSTDTANSSATSTSLNISATTTLTAQFAKTQSTSKSANVAQDHTVHWPWMTSVFAAVLLLM